MAKPKRVIVYTYAHGNEPFTDWLYGLRDIMGRKRILARIARPEQGNYGDIKRAKACWKEYLEDAQL
jgi:putative component of toxin-antitoxin plasmid stabilization module